MQENTISDLQTELDEKQKRIDELEKNTAATLNFSELSEKAESIFTNLMDTHCGIIADESGEYIILVANTKKDLTDSEKQVIENWLITESGIAKAKLLLNLNR